MDKTNAHDGFSPSPAAFRVIDEGTIASANREAVDRIKAAWPVLLEPVLARDVTGVRTEKSDSAVLVVKSTDNRS